MKKIGIVVDSTANLIDEMMKDLNVSVARTNIIIDGVSYVDGVEITLDEVIQAAEEGKKVTSSQPSPQAFVDCYKEQFMHGYEEVVVLTVSSGVSGTYQSAVLSTELTEGMKIRVIDTKSCAMGVELLVDEVTEMIHSGANVDEVADELEALVEKQMIRLTIDDLNTLFRGGRMTRSQSIIGSLLKIKPIITVNPEGKLELVDKVRTHRKVLGYLLHVLDKYQPKTENLHVRIGHIKALEVAQQLKDMILEKFEDARVYISKEISPVVSVHLGKGGLGIAWLA